MMASALMAFTSVCRWIAGMGLALAGGIGLSMRAHSLVCDNILAAQLVLANGSVVMPLRPWIPTATLMTA